jgi:hypothetical protein
MPVPALVVLKLTTTVQVSPAIRVAVQVDSGSTDKSRPYSITDKSERV